MEERTRLIATGAKQKHVSKLEPYWEQLKEMRGQGYSFRTLVDVLHEQADLQVSPGTIFKFLESRKNRQPVYRSAETAPVSLKQSIEKKPDSELRRAALEKIRQVAKKPDEEPGDAKFKYSEEPLQFEFEK